MENAEVYITSKEEKATEGTLERRLFIMQFLIRFPLGLDFPFITLPFQDC